MSTTVDQRVVEMQFNNKQFESGVSTTMSTLDKLKQKLNFSGASKGLEEIGASAKKVDMNGLAAGVDTVRAKFSALDVIGVTALSNITNKAVNAGQRMISALTIDPIKTGFEEYETQINAVQTILANTSSKGSTIDDVNTALEELNAYADKTIYNFTEMTRNIGTFTAAGVDLDTSVSAIQGIANLAAVSGSTSQQASTAMYQLSQALSSGTVKLMDWNSVVNAGMGGEVFQNALKDTARIHGVAIDEMIKNEGSFRETLSSGWLTADILTETLNNFTLAAQEGSKEWENYKKTLMDRGYTEKQATEILKMANTATDAATKVKTFTQLWDVMKESAQSGWSQTWKILVGDFEEAKAVLTPLADVITGFINKMSDARNFVVENVFAFGDMWKNIEDKLGFGALDKIKEFTADLEYFQDVVTRVWRGDFNNQGDPEDRFDLLTAAGYDPRVVQSLVNLGYQHKITIEEVEAAHAKFGLTMETTAEETEAVANAVNTLSNEQLINAGLTRQEIHLYRDLEEEAARTGKSIDEIAKEMSEVQGRTLLIEALKNAGNGLIGVFTALGNAWSEVFPPVSIVKLYNVVKAIKEFSEKLVLVTKATDEFGEEYYKLNETGEKFKRIFKGVFSILNIVTTLLGGGFKIAFKVVSAVLKYFNLDILEVLATIGDALTAFGKWFDKILNIEGVVAKVIPWIQKAVGSIRTWITESETLQNIFSTIKDAIGNIIPSIQGWIDGFKQLDFVQEFLTSFNANLERTAARFKLWSDGFRFIFDKFFDAIHSMDEITFEGVFRALIQLRDDILEHFDLFPRIFRDLLVPVGALGKAILEYIGIFDEFETIKDKIGEVIDAFRKWFTELRDAEDPVKYIVDSIKEALGNLASANIFTTIKGKIGEVIDAFGKWFEELRNAEDPVKYIVDSIKDGLNNLVSTLKEYWGKIWGSFNGSSDDSAGAMSDSGKGIGSNLIAGIAFGIWEGVKTIFLVLKTFCTTIVNTVKEMLGIHSPSTVFFAIGGFIIAGLVGGLLAGTGSLKDTMQTLGSKLGEFFGDIDFQSIFSMAISTGLVKALLDVSGTIKKTGGAFVGVLDGFADVMDGVGDTMQQVSGVVRKFKGVLGSLSTSIKAKAIKDIAIALAILAAAVLVLSFIEPKKLWNAVGVIAAIGAVMGILFAVMSNVAGGGTFEDPKDYLKSVSNVVKLGSMLLALSASILLIALAMKILGTIDAESAKYAFGGLAAILIAIAGVLVAYGLCVKGHSAKNIAKLGTTLLMLSLSLLIMAKVIKQLGNLDEDTLKQGGNALLHLVAIMTIMVAMSHVAGNKIGKIGSTLLKMAAAFAVMAIVVKLMGNMDHGELIQGGIALIAFAGIMVGMVAMTKLAGGNSLERLGGTLLAMSGAMLIMAVIVRILGGMEVGPLVKGVIAVAALAGIMVGLVAATKLVGENDLKRVGLTLLMMSVAIGVLAAVALVLGLLPVKYLAKGIIAVTLLGGIMTAMIWATRGANDCKGSILAMVAAIAVMTIAIAALSFIDGTKLAGAVAAMSVLMLIFTLMISVAGKAQGSIGVLIVMTVAMTLMGGLLYLLSTLPVESTLGSAAALSILLLTVAGVVTLLSKMSINLIGALAGVIALTAMAIPLLAFIGVLKKMSGLEGVMPNVLALVTLMGVLTLLLIPLTVIGNFVPGALIGILALTAMWIPMRVFVGLLTMMEGIQNASANAELLTNLMTKLTAMLVVLAVIAPFAMTGVVAMAALTGLIVAVGALAVGVGALMEKFPDLEVFLNKGLPILTEIAYAIGEFAGNLVSGFVETIAGSLPVLGASLSGFMVNAMPFIEGIKMVDASMLEGVGVLTASILALTAASFINGITSLLTLGVGSLPALGYQLSGFMQGAMPFIEGASLIKEDSVAGVKSLADMILTLTKANVIEGLTSWFTGGSSLENFGAQLVPFGEAMVAFSQTVSGIDESAVLAAANAGKMMSEMAATIPNSGGVVGFFTGENDLSTFTAQLVPFGEAIAAFSQTVAGKINEDAVLAAANAGKTMVELADTLPNSGGVVGWFTGENDIATFGTQLVSFGDSIVAFSQAVSGNISEEAVTAAANAGATMVKLAETLPNTGGVVSWFTGDNDLTTFGTQLVEFGSAIVSFSKEVAGLDADAVTAATNAASVMATLANNLPKSGGFASIFTADSDMSTFGKEMVKFGESIKDFSDEVTGLDSTAVSSAVTQCCSIATLAKDMSGTDFGSLSEFGKSLEKVGKTGVEKFAEAFENSESKVVSAINKMITGVLDGINDKAKDFKKSGSKSMEEFIEGVEDKTRAVERKAKTVAGKGATAIREKRESFKSAGKYLGGGLVEGINAKKQAVYDAAYALGQKAVQGEKDGQQSNSPSKLTIQAGRWLGEGLIIGMKEMVGKVYQSGSDLGKSATGSLSTAIRDLSDAINTDIDAQPTIRPVMDLSDVKTGADAINGMFNKNALVGVTANVNGINTMMNHRIQNGTNDEVVSAIDKLRKELGEVERTSYIVNGVTYDDGSSTSLAVKSLVRAIDMERRV